MTTRDRVAIGAAAGLGLAWGLKLFLRARRHITLEGRVVLITGASSGLGLLLAKLAARRGARLVLAARSGDELEAAAEELAALGSPDVLAVPTDVSDRTQCLALVRRALDRHGRIDVLVNNAGIILVGPIESMTADDFESAMEINFGGALNCTLEVLPSMRARRFGRIANVVSVGGKLAIPHLLPYTASKFALTGLTKGLRVELAKDNVLITGVYPDTVRTGGHTHAWIKGDVASEYTWFGLSDTLPGVSLSAEQVAHAIWRAVCDGQAEINLGLLSRVQAKADALFPNASAELVTLMARLLPRSDGPGAAVQGEHVRGAIPDWLNRQVPASTRA
jgi:NAD(P)-dependent dehydrogenase (short-subunit alcohol dehydrogenase family)